MEHPQEQKFLRALHMLGGIIIECAHATDTQDSGVAQSHFKCAEAYHDEILKLINPELQFPT